MRVRTTAPAGLTALVLAMAAWPVLAEPVRGGTAIIAVDSDPETLNAGLTTGYSASHVAAKVFEGLVWIDPDGAPQPSLAAGWTISEDGLTYTFDLQDGVTWHDGEAFTSADVVFTFEEVLSKLHPRMSSTMERLGAGFAAPDEDTFVVTLERPFAPFLRQLWVFDAPILPEHVYAGTDIATNPANQAPIGTGPFVFDRWDRGAALFLERNASYWVEGQPYLDEVIFQVVPQPTNRTAGLETGEIDFVVDFYLPKAEVPRLVANSDLQEMRGRTIPAMYFLMTNTAGELFDDVRARQALAFAVDRERLVAQAMNGFARTAAGAFGDGFPWLVNEDVHYDTLYPFDTERAQALFAEAGIAEGTEVRLTYDSNRAQMVASAQIVRENLRAAGLEVVLEPLERSVLIDKVFAARDFDLTLQSFYSAGDPAIGYHRIYLTNETDRRFTNASGFSDPEVDAMLGEAATATDLDRRGAIYKELQVKLNEELPSVMLFEEEGVDFATKRLGGLWASLDSRDRWGGVWLNP